MPDSTAGVMRRKEPEGVIVSGERIHKLIMRRSLEQTNNARIVAAEHRREDVAIEEAVAKYHLVAGVDKRSQTQASVGVPLLKLPPIGHIAD